MADNNLKVKKEDKDLYNESLQDIAKLSNIIQTVESQQEGNKETFKKTLNDLIPKLDGEINELFEKAQDAKFLQGENMEKVYDILKDLDAIEANFQQLEERAATYNKWQEVLETQPTVFENLDQTREELTLRCLMWRSLNTWQDMNEKWYKTQFSQVEAKDIAKEAEKYFKIALRLEKNLEPNLIQEKLKSAVETFKEAMPIVTALRNDKLGEHHWAQIKDLIKKDFDIAQEDFTLKSLIDLDVNQFQEEIVAISTQATQEANLRTQINDLEEVWKKVIFTVEWEEKCESYILKDLDEIFNNLDESLANINMILGSRFVKPLRTEAEQWKKWIMTLSDMVDEWIMCQKNWMYLENIYIKAADIRKAMMEETKKFEAVDKFFKQLMAKTQKQPNCLKIVKQHPQTLDHLRANNEVLDEVQKRLEDYMELKRKAFPRFYFLSNDELIDVLAHSQELDIVQQHLKTCFDNIVSLDINDEAIEAMNSTEKEKVPLKRAVKARGMIETWLE